MISRRRFLWLVGGASIIATYVGISFGRSTYVDYIAHLIYKNCGNLNINKEMVRRFAIEFIKNNEGFIKMERTVFIKLYFLARMDIFPALMPGNIKSKFMREERRIVTSFLMSTNLFYKRSADSQAISYIGTGALCNNPFAKF